MQWRQAKILYILLGISIKQGRAAEIRVPAPSAYIRMVRDLFMFHRATLRFNFNGFRKAVEAADFARNILAHSVYLVDKQTRELRIQIVRGNWELEHDVVTVSRAIQPEARTVNREFLLEQRAAVEAGIVAVEVLGRLVDQAMSDINARRAESRTADRRKTRPNGGRSP
jgi:autonomous glycyl radical cofactor GrcA